MECEQERSASEKRIERKPDCKCENKSRPTLKEPDRGPRFQEGRPHRAKRRATLAELSVRRDEACIKHSFPTRFCPRAGERHTCTIGIFEKDAFLHRRPRNERPDRVEFRDLSLEY